MIDQLDLLLRKFLTTRIDEITSDVQVRFQPPDEDWRNVVRNLTVGGNLVNSLNVYLIDLRENRKLRSNETLRQTIDGTVFETPAPKRVDCHYLVSAWSPADTTPMIEPTLDEHALLAKVASALAEHEALDANAIYAPVAPPAAMTDLTLPLAVLPTEGFLKLAEFWGTMGEKHRWKPVVYIVVTIPLTLATLPSGPPVTTLLTDTRFTGGPSDATVHQIGGIVSRLITPPAPQPAHLEPVAGAWVELLDATATKRLALVRSDAQGRFQFMQLRGGAYQLRASAMGLAAQPPRPIKLPEPSGNYDLTL